MKYVFVLWHSYELNDGEEDSKLLGIYSSASIANEKTNEYKKLTGFSDHPSMFEVVKYEIGVDHWQEGFVTRV